MVKTYTHDNAMVLSRGSKNEEQVELPYIVGGNAKLYSNSGKVWQIHMKSNIHLPYDRLTISWGLS